MKTLYKIIFCFLFFLSIYTVNYGNNIRKYCDTLVERAYRASENKDYVKALTMLMEAKSLANPDWGNMQMKILNEIGNVHSMILDYNTAIDYYLDAYKIAIEKSDISTQISILNNIGTTYNYQGKPEEGRVYIEKAYQMAVQQNDSLNIGLLAINRAGDLYLLKKLEEMMQYIAISRAMLQNYPQEWYALCSMKQLEAFYYDEKGQYDVAIKLVIKSLNEFSEIESKHFKGNFLSYLSTLYYESGDKEKAIEVSKEALKYHYLNLYNRIGIYQDLVKYYREENMLSLALLYQDSVIWGKDSLKNLNLNDKILNDKMRLDVFHLEKQLAEDKAKRKMEHVVFTCVVAFVLILAIVLIVVFRLQSTKNRQKKIIAENRQIIAEKQQKITEFELEKEKDKKMLLKRKLKEQETSALQEQEYLNNKNKQLSSKIVLESNKNELIEEIIDKLSSISEELQNDNLKSVIKQLKELLRESPQWDNFHTYFEQINPLFLSSLKKKHPELTRSDIRYLSYIYLNLNTKEIASLLHISEASCKKKKQRIAEKMNLETGKLYNYLLTLG